MKLNILIDAGGTNEKIDDVRYITNHATGQLGKIIAETFLQYEDIHVFYVHGKNASIPNTITNRLHLFPITSVQDLDATLQHLLLKHNFYAVIHSMAVSDYQVDKTISESKLVKKVVEYIQDQPSENLKDYNQLEKEISDILQSLPVSSEKKISSQDTHLYIRLEQTPKIINKIKQWQPTTKLVGFKLLVDVPHQELIDVAFRLLEKNNCHFVLANDLTSIDSHQHIGYLVNRNKEYKTFYSKQAIADGIVQHLLDR